MSLREISRNLISLAFLIGSPDLLSGREIPLGWFNPSNFRVEESVTLCFDLNPPAPPRAAVVIKLPPQFLVAQRSVILPFTVSSVDPNKEAYLTWGCFDELTLINFINSQDTSTSFAVTFTPRVDEATESDFVRTDLPGVLYYLESGLKRRFVYRLDAASALSRDGPLSKLPVEVTNTVAVRLPVGAEMFDAREGVAPAIRKLNLASGNVRHYATANMATAGKYLDIVYQVQPTKLQSVFFEYGLKLFGAFIIPLLGVVLLTSDQAKQHRRLRMRILWIGGLIETILLVALLWWAFKIRSVTGLGALLEIGVAVLGAVATAGLGLVKDRANA